MILPRSVRLTKYLVFSDAVIWMLLAVVIAVDLHPALPVGAVYRWIMASLALMAGIFLIGDYWIMIKRGGWAFYLMLGALAVISLLTLFDQFGFPDLIVLLINVLSFALLLKDRSFYLRQAKAIES